MKRISCLVGEVAFAIGLGCFDQSASATVAFLQFAGNNANGDVDGTPFSGASWLLEFGVETCVGDSDTSEPFIGNFPNSIREGRIRIDSNWIELGGTSITGTVLLEDSSKPTLSLDGDSISVLPDSGGFMSFVTGDNGLFPPLFSDNNFLTSANLGTTVFDTTTDSFNNPSELRFDGENLLGATGEQISIFAQSPPASGNFSVTASATSAIPEPTSSITWSLIVLTLLGRYGHRE